MSASLARFQTLVPSPYKGLDGFVSEEMKPFVLELIKRLSANQDKLLSDLTNQVPSDPDILPTLTRGSAASPTTTLATLKDLDQSMFVSIMLSS